MSINFALGAVKPFTKKIVKHIQDEEAKTEVKKQTVIKAKNDYAQNYRATPRPRVRGGYSDTVNNLQDVNEHKWKGVIR